MASVVAEVPLLKITKQSNVTHSTFEAAISKSKTFKSLIKTQSSILKSYQIINSNGRKYEKEKERTREIARGRDRECRHKTFQKSKSYLRCNNTTTILTEKVKIINFNGRKYFLI